MITNDEFTAIETSLTNEVGHAPLDGTAFRQAIGDAVDAARYSDDSTADCRAHLEKLARNLKEVAGEVSWLMRQGALINATNFKYATDGRAREPIFETFQRIQGGQHDLTRFVECALSTLPDRSRGRPKGERPWGPVIFHLAQAYLVATDRRPGVSTIKDGMQKGGPFYRFVAVALPIVTGDTQAQIAASTLAAILRELRPHFADPGDDNAPDPEDLIEEDASTD
ncbi:MAG TPA: hypothetical protein VGE72_17105 [Azospirillum sp.]